MVNTVLVLPSNAPLETTERLGIDALKKVSLSVLEFARFFREAMKDGRLSWGERFELLSLSIRNGNILAKHLQVALLELNDLDEGEVAELLAFLSSELGLQVMSIERVQKAITGVLLLLDAIRSEDEDIVG